MIGVLVDVSGSMKSAYALDRSSDVNVERIHAILTTVVNIVKREVVHHELRESIFACAFGLCGPTVTCDLISLLEYIALAKDSQGKDGYQALIDLAKQRGAPQAEPWIRNHLSEVEAQILYTNLCFDESLMSKLVQLIPSQLAITSAKSLAKAASLKKASPLTLVGMFTAKGRQKLSDMQKASEAEMVHKSEAYTLAREIIEYGSSPLHRIKQPKPRPVQHVSELLDELLLSKDTPPAAASAPSSPSLHDRIQELIELIKPYIFGETPMCEALNAAAAVFNTMNENPKVLFILSDGESTDGNPCPIAQELRDLGVTIVTCFLTSDRIRIPRCLFDEPDPNWTGYDVPQSSYLFDDLDPSLLDLWSRDGRSILFEMSSTMKNTHAPISYLVDANWELPPSGASRLFVQANSLDVVNEFCQIVVSQMTKSCDVLVHILEKVPLATYINQRNAEFEPQKQERRTCYANAIAAVFHLAMHRIVGREGGIPEFCEIRQRIVDEYGIDGADTKKVLENLCPEYRLHFRQVDETGARRAINERRPVVATFFLYDEQWTKFLAFYRKTPKGILNKDDITGEYTTLL